MVLVALALRVSYVLLAHTYQIPAGNDRFAMGFEAGSIGRSIASGHGFASPFGGATGPTAWLAPVYPYLIAGVLRIFGLVSDTSAFVMFLLNSVFSALTCIPICLIARRVFGRAVAMWSGWLWAVVPLFMRWPTTWIWEVSLSALLLACLVLQALKAAADGSVRRWFGFGALWGLAALTNPSLLTCLPITLGWAAWQLRRSGKGWTRPALVAVLACVAVITPWVVRNRVVMGQFVFIRDNFAYEFRLGNYHGSNGMGWSGPHPTRNPRTYNQYKQIGELAFVAQGRDQAMRFVRQYPGEFVRLTLKRFVDFWYGEHLLYFGPDEPWRTWMFWPFSLMAAFGVLLALDRRKAEAWMLGAVLLFYPAAYYLTYPQVRYRHAVEPEMLILTVFLVAETGKRILRRT